MIGVGIVPDFWWLEKQGGVDGIDIYIYTIYMLQKNIYQIEM